MGTTSQRFCGITRKISGDRSPGDGQIHIAARDCLDQPGGGIGFLQSAEDVVADQVSNDSARDEGMDRRQLAVVITEHIYANPKRAQPGIVQRVDVQIAVAARNEDVAGTIIGPRCADSCHARGNAHHDVAQTGIESLVEEGLPLRKPGVGNAHAQVFRDHPAQFVFKPLFLLV